MNKNVLALDPAHERGVLPTAATAPNRNLVCTSSPLLGYSDYAVAFGHLDFDGKNQSDYISTYSFFLDFRVVACFWSFLVK